MASSERTEVKRARRRQLVATLVAAGSHGLLLLAASQLHGNASVPDTKILVDIVDPPPPAPPPEEPPRPDETVRHAAASRSHGLRRLQETPSEAPLPSEASPDLEGRVPLDLTDQAPVVGTSGRGTGSPVGNGDGLGSARGNGDKPGLASTGQISGPDRSTTVSLEGQSWTCPWPPEADSEQIDEQTVVIRVVVDPDGSAESAEIILEPGHGFGKAAVACALRTHFTPAHDRDGNAIRTRSPPIRVRFTR
jgi:protein TonB